MFPVQAVTISDKVCTFFPPLSRAGWMKTPAKKVKNQDQDYCDTPKAVNPSPRLRYASYRLSLPPSSCCLGSFFSPYIFSLSLSQNFLVLRSLHQWLVEGRTALDGHAVAAAAAATVPLAAPRPTIGAASSNRSPAHRAPPPPPPLSSSGAGAPVLLPGSVRVDAEFLGLVGAAAGGNGAAGEEEDTGGFSLFPPPASEPREEGEEEDVTKTITMRAASDTSAFVAGNTRPATTTAWGRGGGNRGEEVRAAIATSIYIPTPKRMDRGKWGSVHERSGGAADLEPPRVGDRVSLSGKRCLVCRLPFNWPGKATTTGAASKSSGIGWGGGIVRSLLSSGYSLWMTAAPTTGGGTPASSSSSRSISRSAASGAPSGGSAVRSHNHHRRRQHSQWQSSSSSSSPRPLDLDELYVILDERSLMIAVPDPDSSHNGRGLLVSVAPLRNTAAKSHPANPRVLELRVSTREESRAGSSGGPGLFLPVPVPETEAPRMGGGADGGNSFRGAGHRGVWHLVRGFCVPFVYPCSCRLTAQFIFEAKHVGGEGEESLLLKAASAVVAAEGVFLFCLPKPHRFLLLKVWGLPLPPPRRHRRWFNLSLPSRCLAFESSFCCSQPHPLLSMTLHPPSQSPLSPPPPLLPTPSTHALSDE